MKRKDGAIIKRDMVVSVYPWLFWLHCIVCNSDFKGDTTGFKVFTKIRPRRAAVYVCHDCGRCQPNALSLVRDRMHIEGM